MFAGLIEVKVSLEFTVMRWPLDRIKPFASPALAVAFLKSHHRRLAALASLVAMAGLIAAWAIKRQADREFEAARALSEARAFAPFEKEPRRAFAGDEVRLIQSSRATRGLAGFNGSIFAATDGGLVEFGEDGGTKRRYTTLDGLPESDLTSIAVFNSRLFIGSRSQGLIVFDGKRFERYRWTDRDAQAVTVLLEDRGRLLIGTFAGGLLEFDGGRFREIKAESDQKEQKRLAGVNCLSTDGARLFVGTFADGLWINEPAPAAASAAVSVGGWSHFTVADGLPSNRVVGVAVDGDRLIVASDFGVAAGSLGSSQRRFQTIATLPELSSAIRYGGAVLLCKDNGEIFRLNDTLISPVEWNRPEGLSSCQLAAFANDNQSMGDTLWLTSGEGLWRLGWQDERLSGAPRVSLFGEEAPPATARRAGPLIGATGGSERGFGATPDQSLGALKSNVITALAFDDLGRLWAGSFRDGVDVIASADGLGGCPVAHLESETVREINALVWDGRSRRMLAATGQGLIRFDSSFGSERLSKADGLLSDSILSAALIQDGGRASLALGASRGLSFGEARRFRGLTTIQGLPASGVYSVLSHREFIYAGTLGGLAQIAGGRVVRVFKDSNSKLMTNWVTALCVAGPRLFVGTHGGGVYELTAAGEMVSFASEIGRQTVNQNAMASDGERLYVGTLDGAWAMDLRSRRWTRLKDELPASVVLSVAVAEKHVYFGSTNGIARIDKSYWEKSSGKRKE